MTKTHAGIVVTLIIVIIVLLIGPFSIGYTLTSSMQPSISPGDAFITISHQPIDTGDVIVYNTPDNGYIVHKVVDVVPSGFITKGVNNVATDQSGDIPVVQPSMVTSSVLMIAGSPVTIPFLGYAIAATSSVALWVLLVVSLMGALYIPGITHIKRVLAGDSIRDVVHSIVTTNIQIDQREQIVWASIITLSAISTSVMVFFATPVSIPVSGGDTFTIGLGGFSTILTTVVETSGDITVTHSLTHGSVTGTVTSPDTYRGIVHVYILPGGILQGISTWLYTISPWVAGGVFGISSGSILTGTGLLIGYLRAS